MSTDQIAADYARDYADKRTIEDLADTIRRILNEPPRNLSNQSRNALIIALSRLEADAARVVKRWD